jgi:hypothetical protein
MDHLGIRQFFFFGNRIGGSLALKLMEQGNASSQHQAVGGRDPVIAIHEGAVKCDPAAGLSIVINLAQIFKGVRPGDR